MSFIASTAPIDLALKPPISLTGRKEETREWRGQDAVIPALQGKPVSLTSSAFV